MEYEAKQSVHIPVEVFFNLEFHLMDTRPGVAPDIFVTELVKKWLAAEAERLALRNAGPALRGVQWKTVFLPDGTTLRTKHGDKIEFAKVIGDHIVSADGMRLTPSLFANRHAQGRNAWRFVWLRFPGEVHWFRADECRARCGDISRKRSKAELRVV